MSISGQLACALLIYEGIWENAMKEPGRILIVDDNRDLLIATRLLLKRHYSLVLTADDPRQIPNLLSDPGFDVVLLDMNFTRDATSGKEGFAWLDQILSIDPGAVVVLMTAFADIRLAVDAIKSGASDFIAKPCSNDHILASMAAAFRHVESNNALQKIRQEKTDLSHLLDQDSNQFIGESPAMQKVFETIEKAAKTDASVLLLGETGTGKGLAAHCIHRASLRADKALIPLDIGALAESLFESELFGHKRGAFTDAQEDRIGRFELASGGTLFLDELGNLPLAQQAKLLSALQSGEITPVGGTYPIKTDARLVCASNENLHDKITEGRFRPDLMYRINTVEIILPPLRERRIDIPLLVDYYLEHFCRKYKVERTIKQADMQHLARYDWPGNVRELAHAMERAVILSENHHIDVGLLIGSTGLATARPESSDSEVFNLNVVEEATIQRAVEYFRGNLSQAAKALGLSRGALYRRLDKYDL